MSLAARGLLATILSLPDDWEFSEAGLVSILSDGRRKVHGAILELERAGYIVRHSQGRAQGGKLLSPRWDVYESPQVATDARNVQADANRGNDEKQREKAAETLSTDVRNVQADASRENDIYSQVATDVRFPRAVNVHQLNTYRVSKQDKVLSELACPKCGGENVERNSAGVYCLDCDAIVARNGVGPRWGAV